MTRIEHFKYPPGFFTSAPVVANESYPKVYPRVPRDEDGSGRKGIVTAPTAKKDYVLVLWNGRGRPEQIHRNLIDVDPSKVS